MKNLANRTTSLQTLFLLSCFISNLSISNHHEVQAIQPLTLIQVVALANLQKENLLEAKTFYHPWSTSSHPLIAQYPPLPELNFQIVATMVVVTIVNPFQRCKSKFLLLAANNDIQHGPVTHPPLLDTNTSHDLSNSTTFFLQNALLVILVVTKFLCWSVAIALITLSNLAWFILSTSLLKLPHRWVSQSVTALNLFVPLFTRACFYFSSNTLFWGWPFYHRRYKSWYYFVVNRPKALNPTIMDYSHLTMHFMQNATWVDLIQAPWWLGFCFTVHKSWPCSRVSPNSYGPRRHSNNCISYSQKSRRKLGITSVNKAWEVLLEYGKHAQILAIDLDLNFEL